MKDIGCSTGNTFEMKKYVHFFLCFRTWNFLKLYSLGVISVKHRKEMEVSISYKNVVCQVLLKYLKAKLDCFGNCGQIVKGLGETLVGAYSGRALSFVAKKSDIKNPKVRLDFLLLVRE
jgi:hypothetical protein